ncbi:hypothetical protein [uncultured Kordia sp.]|uniref:hypothetical protein n=1 Tax=uncultured Kordia sp. TaxID=507699 RepID=UPI00260BFFAA|nr:hypothetical protein [uncultured Kordia sp.]
MSNRSRLFSNGVLNKGERLMSNNSRYKLELLDDGNLVFYDNGKEKWSTRTDKKNGDKCVMQHDGNFVVLNGGRNPIWTTGTYGNKGSYLAIQDDGKLVIYKPSMIKNVLKVDPL